MLGPMIAVGGKGGKGYLLSYLVTKALLGQPNGVANITLGKSKKYALFNKHGIL